MEKRFDLHCHSIFSDGSDTPQELLQLAVKRGLAGLSITDHDTTEAYVPALFDSAKKLGLRLLCGVEISTEYYAVNIHVLGYGFDLESPDLKKALSSIRESRRRRNLQILEKLAKKGMPIDPLELYPESQTVRIKGRPHIAALMIAKGYVSTMQEAFAGYLDDNASCYVTGMKYSTQLAIEVLHKAGGKAILAHPGQIRKQEIVKNLLKMPFDGLEGYYSVLPPARERKWQRIARLKNWIIAGGSDYHGAVRPFVQLGCSYVSEEVFNAFF